MIRTICFASSLLLLAGCAAPVQVVVKGSGVAWPCPAEPAAPVSVDGGFYGPGVVAIREHDGAVHTLPDGYALSSKEWVNVADYITSLRTAQETCAVSVRELNKLLQR